MKRFGWLSSTGIIITATLFALSGCSADNASTARQAVLGHGAQEIQGGAVDTTDTYVVGICGGVKGNCDTVCSGTLIAPNVVLTARHCVDHTPEQIDCSTNPQFGAPYGGPMYVTTSSDMGQASEGWHKVKSVVTPTPTDICGNDLAILVLVDLIAATEAKPVIPAVQYPMTDARYSTRFNAIGFGVTSPAGQGAGTRRIKTSVDEICVPGSDTIDCPATVMVNDNEFIAGSATCQGDSGSGAYETASYGTSASVTFGVLSRGGVSSDNTTCEGSLYTRLDKFRDLIVSTITDASGGFTLYPKPSPDWTVLVAPTADAGTDAKPTKPAVSLGIGEACTDDKDCTSKACGGDGIEKVCTSACSSAADCAYSFECRLNLCLAPPAPVTTPAAQTVVTTTTGCSLSTDPQPTPWFSIGISAAVVGMVAARRRKNS